jgi:hypothetical protein
VAHGCPWEKTKCGEAAAASEASHRSVEHCVGEYISRCPMPLQDLHCQVLNFSIVTRAHVPRQVGARCCRRAPLDPRAGFAEHIVRVGDCGVECRRVI